jgi:hypothetical protein
MCSEQKQPLLEIQNNVLKVIQSEKSYQAKHSILMSNTRTANVMGIREFIVTRLGLRSLQW